MRAGTFAAAVLSVGTESNASNCPTSAEAPAGPAGGGPPPQAVTAMAVTASNAMDHRARRTLDRTEEVTRTPIRTCERAFAAVATGSVGLSRSAGGNGCHDL